MAKLMYGRLQINNLQIIDIASDELATTVDNTGKYKLKICIKNSNANDSKWYDNISLRVIPVGTNIQFYTDSSFAQTSTSNRFDPNLFKLKSKEMKWFTIYFKWTGSSSRITTKLKFDIGIYANELPIGKAWKRLSLPI